MWGYRQNVTQFNIKKDQKKTIRKMMNFLKSNQEIDTYEEKEEKK